MLNLIIPSSFFYGRFPISISVKSTRQILRNHLSGGRELIKSWKWMGSSECKRTQVSTEIANMKLV